MVWDTSNHLHHQSKSGWPIHRSWKMLKNVTCHLGLGWIWQSTLENQPQQTSGIHRFKGMVFRGAAEEVLNTCYGLLSGVTVFDFFQFKWYMHVYERSYELYDRAPETPGFLMMPFFSIMSRSFSATSARKFCRHSEFSICVTKALPTSRKIATKHTELLNCNLF